jgi:hypothetical protein
MPRSYDLGRPPQDIEASIKEQRDPGMHAEEAEKKPIAAYYYY